MKKTVLAMLLLMLIGIGAKAQRQMEQLDRGLVAVKTASSVFVSWRLLGEEWYGVTYNIYRDGTKLNSQPLSVSNYSDTGGTITSQYQVSAVVNNIEQPLCNAVSPLAQQYKEVALKTRDAAVYQINDITSADLDGDGQYEIIVKRIAPGWNENNTNYTYFEAYKLDGTFMWEINVGPNILPDVEINIAAFDFDEDGKAEVFMRTSEGTIFGNGTTIGDTDNDGIINYRFCVGTTANMQYMTQGPEFLSLIDGQTGIELDRTDFIPRGAAIEWGDEYGHRCSKYFFGAPYLDGKKPSLFIGRGIYTKTLMSTYDVVNKKMVLRWEFKSSGGYSYQGNHNYTVADVDMDGRDEIVWGSMTVDDNGQGLYTTELGHGDALHVGDLDPYRKGTEIFKCLENSPQWGTVLFDGATGEILIHDKIDRDCGRCCAAKISDDIKGKALWGSGDMFSATTHAVMGSYGGPVNFRIYWDGDLCEEMVDHVGFSTATGYGTGSISKYASVNNAPVILEATGSNSCNYTKGTPCLQADLFGDWREEVIWRRNDNQAVRIYTTINPTIYRNYTLMHDHQYRQAICWQMCGYNQPPHVSYYLGKGENITVPPPPTITNNRLVYNGQGTWDKTSTVWNKNGLAQAYADGEHVLFDVVNGTNVTLSLAETVAPSVVTVNSPGSITLNATNGKISGEAKMVKQGKGTFTLNGSHDFTGTTEIWAGQMAFDGTLTESPVWLGLFGELAAKGQLNKGVSMRYGSILYVGGNSTTGSLTIGDSLAMESGAIATFDMYAPASELNDVLTINGKLVFGNGAIIKVVPHLTGGATKLAPGEYVLATVTGTITGNVASVVLEGLDGLPCSVEIKDGKLVLVIDAVRKSSQVVWDGALNNGTWDLAATTNVLKGGVADIFVTGDTITFNDAATKKAVLINTELLPNLITVDASSYYLMSGTGSLAGTASFTKTGSGHLTLSTTNTFTGKVTLNQGILEIKNASALGAESSLVGNFLINGGMMVITTACEFNRALTIGANGATIQNGSQVYYNYQITGGVLTKTSGGNLIFAKANNNSKTIIKGGTVSLLNEEALPGAAVDFQGGTLQCYNADTYSSSNFPLYVGSGQSGTLICDARCSYNNTLTGNGTLTVSLPGTIDRSMFFGNWSAFAGTINLTGKSFRIANSYGYANATFNLASGVSMYHGGTGTSGGDAVATTVNIGALQGVAGSTIHGESWVVGAKNISTTFAGTISGYSLKKVGTATLTLSGVNTYTGGTTVSEGTLFLSNVSGSATGTGAVAVKSGATLQGTGISTSTVTAENGSTVVAGNTLGTTLTVGTLNLANGASLSVLVNPTTSAANKLVATGTISLNGQLVLTKSVETPYQIGQSFKILTASSISGALSGISPATPGDGMAWDLSELNTTGTIKVTSVATALSKRLNATDLVVFPNPFTNEVTVKLPVEAATALITVENMNGQRLYAEEVDNLKSQTVMMDNLPVGIYMIKVETDNAVYVQKAYKKP